MKRIHKTTKGLKTNCTSINNSFDANTANYVYRYTIDPKDCRHRVVEKIEHRYSDIVVDVLEVKCNYSCYMLLCCTNSS